jgi:uncharacterized protein (TIGR02996 family)
VTDGDVLLLTIRSNPSDDLSRLIYADWLDEVGEADRAALIRAQIEESISPSPDLSARVHELLGPVGDRVWQRRREWALPHSMLTQWPDDVGGWEWHRGFPEVWHCPLALWESHGPRLVSICPVRRVVLIDREPRRSPGNPRKPERAWLRNEADWLPRPDERCLLPAPLFDLLEQDAFDFAMFDHIRIYPTRAAAVEALSDACLQNAARGACLRR